MSNRARSSLGLCHPRYDAVLFIRSFRRSARINFGWLDNFFNPQGSHKASLIMSLPRKKAARVHIINGPGMNNNRVQPHEISFGYTNDSLSDAIRKQDAHFLAKFEERCKHIAKIASHAPEGTLELFVCPWLERHAVPTESLKLLGEIIHNTIPFAQLVDNPVPGYSFMPGWLRESHDPAASPDRAEIFDLDGADMMEVDIYNYALRHKNARLCFAWCAGENGAANGGPWLPPDKRKDFSSKRENPIFTEFLSDNFI